MEIKSGYFLGGVTDYVRSNKICNILTTVLDFFVRYTVFCLHLVEENKLPLP